MYFKCKVDNQILLKVGLNYCNNYLHIKLINRKFKEQI